MRPYIANPSGSIAMPVFSVLLRTPATPFKYLRPLAGRKGSTVVLPGTRVAPGNCRFEMRLAKFRRYRVDKAAIWPLSFWKYLAL
jgi:hypothetical protein